MNIRRNTFLAFSIIIIFLISPVGQISQLAGQQSTSAPYNSRSNQGLTLNNHLTNQSTGVTSDNAGYSQNSDIGKVLQDNPNIYEKVWDPWLTKAAIHAIASTDDGNILGIGGGYLYGEEIRIYRWNTQQQKYDFVDKIGGDVITSDVLELQFADTDHNNLTELIVGTDQGRLLVFEQTAIYDPYTNLESNFVLVYESPYIGRIFDLDIYDTDKDFKKDIIVGAGQDVIWYEYSDHGSYPFSQDHFIEYKEVHREHVSSPITAISHEDSNQNGLYGVAVGMRSGEIVTFENAGELLNINGTNYPIYQDNNYTKIYSTGSTIRRAISDMSSGDLDQDGYEELIIAAQGQGSYIMDKFNGKVGVQQLHRPFKSWESSASAPFPLDYYADFIVNSSSLQSRDGNQFNYTSNPNVFFSAPNGTLYPEPMNDSVVLDFPGVNPYRSGSVQTSPNQYTVFNGTSRSAWQTYDMGKDEEGSSNGLDNVPDITLEVTNGIPTSDLQISISQDGTTFATLNKSMVSYNGYNYTLEIDPVLDKMSWDWWQYIKINVTGSVLYLDSIQTHNVNNVIYDGLSTEIGTVDLKHQAPRTAGYIATIDGSLLAIAFNETLNEYGIVWDSYNQERFSLGDNVFDLELIKKQGRFPAWLFKDTNFQLDLSSSTLPDGGEAIDYAAANFYNWKNGKSVEYLVMSSKKNLYVYTQDGNGAPVYDPDLTTALISNDLQTTLNFGYGDYLHATVSLVPIASIVDNGYTSLNPQDNGYYLIIGGWNGTTGTLGNDNPPTVSASDFSMFYLNATTNTGQCDNLPTCMTFKPVLSGGQYNDVDLADIEGSGALAGIISTTTALPHVVGADMVGDNRQDLIVSNGKLHLLANDFSNPQDKQLTSVKSGNAELIDKGLVPNKFFSKMSYSYVSGYFDGINSQTNQRRFERVQVVNFDGDNDFDIILGLQSYSDTYYGLSRTGYGMTYFENQGTRDNPKWVERKSAVTNNDPDSNFRVHRYSRPTLLFNNYNIGELNAALGYHPLLRTNLPTSLLMFQPNSDSDLYNGKLQEFKADYAAQTSLLAATYPEAKRLDLNLKYQNDSSKVSINYGYHIFETWDNSRDLQNWTLSLDVADVDQDGKKEVVVGDFSNKVYLFEHLTNNTFKRAYHTFNANYTTRLNQTPYAYSQFQGLSGDFTRRIYDHFTKVIAGVDLNGNGLLEFIGVTQKQILIFESQTTAIGNIRDDTYSLRKIIDIRSLKPLMQVDSKDMKISVLQTANDLTADGRGELILSVDNVLLMYEINPDFSFEEVFQGDRPLGQYNIPGNPASYPNYKINAVLVADTTNNGYQNLVIGGETTGVAEQITKGFVFVMEWRNSTLKYVASDVFDQTLEYSPVTSLNVADQDSDYHYELLIGHENGVDIYEYQASGYTLVEAMSGNPAYGVKDREYYTGPDPITVGGTLIGEKAVTTVGLALKMIYVLQSGDAKSGITYEIHQSTSLDNGRTWTYDGRIQWIPTSEPSGSIVNIESLDILDDGSDTWISFVAVYYNSASSTASKSMYVIKNPNPGGLATDGYRVFGISGTQLDKYYMTPKLFDYNGANSSQIGVAINYRVGNVEPLVFLRVDIGLNPSTTTYFYSTYKHYTYANQTNVSSNFKVHSLDVVQYPAPNDDQYGLIFAGNPIAAGDSLEHDLYFADFSVKNGTQFTFDFERPRGAYDTAYDTIDPSIILDTTTQTNALLVSFTQETTSQYGGSKAIWSSDYGSTWHGAYDMNDPLGFDSDRLRAYPDTSGHGYTVGLKSGKAFLKSFLPSKAELVQLPDSGYTMVTSVSSSFEQKSGFDICTQNPFEQSFQAALFNNTDCTLTTGINNVIESMIYEKANYSRYPISTAQQVVVGDSDKDQRHEILIAEDNDVKLFEFDRSSAGSIQHSLAWTSPSYDRGVTGIAMADINGDNYGEILIESTRGIVNGYQLVNKESMKDLLQPQLEETASYTAANDPIRTIIRANIDSDPAKEIIYSTAKVEVVAMNPDFTKIWQGGIAGSTVHPYRDDLIKIPDQPYLIQINNRSILLINTTNGSQLDLLPAPNDITAFTADYLGSDTPTFFLALANGEIYNVTYQDTLYPNYFNSVSLQTGPSFVSDLKVNNIGGTKALVVVTTDGVVKLLNESGSEIWSKDYATTTLVQNHKVLFGSDATSYVAPLNYSISGIIMEDFNGDQKNDIVFGSNRTLAIDGTNGDILWKRDLNGTKALLGDPTLADLNNDSTPDLIYSTFYGPNQESEPSMFGVDGKTGDTIWDYTEHLDGYYVYADHMATGTLTLNKTLQTVATTMFGFSISGNGFSFPYQLNPYDNLTLISNQLNGEPLAALTHHSRPTTVMMGGPSFPQNSVLVGLASGKLQLFTLWDGKTLHKYNGSINQGDLADVSLNRNMDKSAGILNDDINTDGYDDLLIIDKDSIQVLDGKSSNSGELNTIWKVTDSTYGNYSGKFLLDDIDNDGLDEIVIGFSNQIVSFNLEDGSIAWSYSTILENYDADPNPEFLGIQFSIDKSTSHNYLLATANIKVAGTNRFSYLYINCTSGNSIYSIDSKGVFYQTSGDVDNDGYNEVISTFRQNMSAKNSSISISDDQSHGGSSLYSATLHLLGPIHAITTGDFDNTIPGEEIALISDYSLTGQSLGYDLNQMPSEVILAGFNATAPSNERLILPSKQTYRGIAELGGQTIDSIVADIDNNGNDDLILQSIRGYSAISTEPTHNSLFNSSGSLRMASMPYSADTEVVGDFCGTTSMVAIDGGYTVSCYDSLNFTTAQQVWSVKLAERAQALIAGDFAGTGTKQLAVLDQSGGIHFISGVGATSSHHQDQFELINESGSNSLSPNQVATIVLLFLIPGIMILYRREIIVSIKSYIKKLD